jgi:hypothetical protein
MTSDPNKKPRWTRRALQGIAYWMGHRRCLYRDYPLSEGALVAEICNLIYANLPDDLELHCEVQYAKFLKSTKDVKILQSKSRADLVIAKKAFRANSDPVPEFIIEVKRASTSKGLMDADLQRLAAARRLCPNARAFLFVISEANRPRRFVLKEGHSIGGKHPIPKSDGYYRVRRTWKAAPAFNNREHAQYACLIEVYADRKSR